MNPWRAFRLVLAVLFVASAVVAMSRGNTGLAVVGIVPAFFALIGAVGINDPAIAPTRAMRIERRAKTSPPIQWRTAEPVMRGTYDALLLVCLGAAVIGYLA
jgi:hypothetical protein